MKIKLSNGVIYIGDCLKVLREKLPFACSDLIFTSLPYNVGKDYGKYKENFDWNSYFYWIEEVLKALTEKLKGNGFMVVNIPDSIIDKETGKRISFSYEYQKILESIGELEYYGRIIWKKGVFSNAFVKEIDIKITEPPLYETHEILLVYRRKPHTKNRPLMPLEISYSDYLTYANSVWEIAPDITRRFYHPAPFPIELPQRIIRHFTRKREVVLDPFFGIGTTGIAATIEGRKFIGIELNPNYIEHFLEDYKTIKRHFEIGTVQKQKNCGCNSHLSKKL